MVCRVESVSYVGHALQEIDYTVTVSNTGNMDLTGVTVKLGRASRRERAASLAVGDSEELTGSHIVTQQEIDAGINLVNTASVTDAQHDTGTLSVTAIVD